MNAVAAIAIALLSAVPDVNFTVARGLKWLADKQNKDGTWLSNGDFLKVNVTSYAGLAMLMQGSTLQEGPYAANLRLTVTWFEKIAQSNGLLVPADDPTEEGRYMQSHCAALLFLASAYDADGNVDHRKRLQKILARAVVFAIEGQTPQGGWGFVSSHESGGNDETPSTVFMVQALLAAKRAGIDVPQAAIDKAARYLVNATNAEGGLPYAPNNAGGAQQLQTAAGAAAFLTNDRRPSTMLKWIQYSRQTLPQAEPPIQINSSILQQHLAAARVIHNLGDGGHRALDPDTNDANLLRWTPHRARLFCFLKTTQNADGSWPDPFIGPVYTTSLALIMLQLDNDYLPAFSR